MLRWRRSLERLDQSYRLRGETLQRKHCPVSFQTKQHRRLLAPWLQYLCEYRQVSRDRMSDAIRIESSAWKKAKAETGNHTGRRTDRKVVLSRPAPRLNPALASANSRTRFLLEIEIPCASSELLVISHSASFFSLLVHSSKVLSYHFYFEA